MKVILFNKKKSLEKIGLSEDSFCRYREVKEYDTGDIVVRTRENGVNGISEDAIKSEFYMGRINDLWDSTYAYYFFRLDRNKELYEACRAEYE